MWISNDININLLTYVHTYYVCMDLCLETLTLLQKAHQLAYDGLTSAFAQAFATGTDEYNSSYIIFARVADDLPTFVLVIIE